MYLVRSVKFAGDFHNQLLITKSFLRTKLMERLLFRNALINENGMDVKSGNTGPLNNFVSNYE